MWKISLLLILFLSLFARADSLSAEFEFGLLATSGNSDGQSINSQLSFLKDMTDWVYKGGVTALFRSSNKETSAEKYSLTLQADKKLLEEKSFYLLLTSEDDRFSGFDHQTGVGLGYGQQLLGTDKHTLRFEIGPGYRINALTGKSDEKELTLRIGESYQWQMSKTATFAQYLRVEGGDDNTISRFGVELKSQLLANFSLNIGVDVKYTEQVPSGSEHSDSETYVRVAYQF